MGRLSRVLGPSRRVCIMISAPSALNRSPAMASLCRLIAIGCLLVGFCANAQVGGSPRGVVLPSPQLIHCRSVECSQLWNRNGGPAGYPAQVLTDVVNGEIVGLTAVYDKSVSIEELRSAIDTLYPNAAHPGVGVLTVQPKRAIEETKWRRKFDVPSVQ